MAGLGAQAFDFIHGRWEVHNTKLRDNTDPSCDEWVEFDATSEAVPVLRGYGHVDRMDAPDPPDGPPFEGLTLRLFDPSDDIWRIWWSSSRAPGHLDPPMIGTFDGERGMFLADDIVGGRPVQVRFEWRADPSEPRWQQFFSYDGGETWRCNWVMDFRPIAGRG